MVLVFSVTWCISWRTIAGHSDCDCEDIPKSCCHRENVPVHNSTKTKSCAHQQYLVTCIVAGDTAQNLIETDV